MGWPGLLALAASLCCLGEPRFELLEADGAPAPSQADVADSVRAGRTLYRIEEERRLVRRDLDRPASGPEAVPLVPAPIGRLRLALDSGCLIVAEDGRGLRLLRLRGHHHGHADGAGGLDPRGVLELEGPFAALAAASGWIYVARDDGEVLVVDARDVDRPRELRTLRLSSTPAALAATGSTLYALGAQGLELFDLHRQAGSGSSVLHPEIRGHALQLAGRRLTVIAEDGSLRLYQDNSADPQLHDISANTNFFSPASLSIAVGDTVRWSNVTGDEHNVFSCTEEQTGCAGVASSESFGSGAPSGLWVYSHTFTQAGANPYTCLPHASFMTGSVTVEPGSAPPPAVPDGVSGGPMTVAKLDPAGDALALSWDVTTCANGADHQLLYGAASSLPASPGEIYFPDGSLCAIGSSPYTWRSSPDASAEMVWWLIVATDGARVEGSWGRDGAGAERAGPGAGGSSGECAIQVKDLTNDCGQ
jgi:plastocyanin